MSVAKVYCAGGVTVYIAESDRPFCPWPAADGLLAQATDRPILRAGTEGLTAFQLIVETTADVTVAAVEGEGLTCINTQGVDASGRPFSHAVTVEAGKPWPLWCLLDSPRQEELLVSLSLADGRSIGFSVLLERSEAYNHTVDEAASLVRLSWLNSREGVADTPTAAFPAVEAEGQTVRLLGRRLTVSPSGGLAQIETYFVGNNSRLADAARPMLEKPLEYEVWENGERLAFVSQSLDMAKRGEAAVSWTAVSVCDGMKLTVTGRAEFDGAVFLNAALDGIGERRVSVRLVHYPRREFARYFMGLGHVGGNRPDRYEWMWDENKHQNAVWCGSMNGGVAIRPTAPNLNRPLVNIYFHHSRNYMPAAWVNEGRGRFTLTDDGAVALAFDSGLLKGDSVSLNAELMISPFRLVDMKAHWNTHYYHKNFNNAYTQEDVRHAAEVGCTHLNVHHGNDTIPYLNYPIHDIEAVADIAATAHRYGLGMKPYYTVRELSTRMPEVFAFRSLGDEIFLPSAYEQGGVPGQGGVDPFIEEHFGDRVLPAWKHVFVGGKYDGTTDPTVATNPAGRLVNYYVASLAWMVDKAAIDGLYIDDVAYGRETMRRVRRVFDERRPSAKLDFHTCNHFGDSPYLGFGWGHNMLIYMELLPYFDSLWVGEGYEYSKATPEYLLTEVSGLPFGVMGELLEGDCNPWRGMLFGMTSRYPYYKNGSGASPLPIWRMRSEFDGARMIGFWEEQQPIWADDPRVKVTVYRAGERMLCCFANFAEQEVTFGLMGEVDGKRLYAPAVEGFQEQRELTADSRITLPSVGGIWIVVE